MNVWVVFLFIWIGLFFGLYNFFIKLASNHIHEVMGAVILQAVAALLGLLVLGYLKFTHHSLEVSSKGIHFSVWAGIFVGLAEIFSFYLFAKGVPISTGLPFIVATTVLVGAMLGMLFLKEPLSWTSGLGIVLTLSGVLLLTFAQGKVR